MRRLIREVSIRRILPLWLIGAVFSGTSCRQDDAVGPASSGTAPTLATTTTAPLAFYQVSAGSNYTCGVTLDSRGFCWGAGALGDGTYSHRTPREVSGGLRFRQVSASTSTCAVTTAYVAYCWGDNFYGEIGDGTTSARATPVRVAGTLRFRTVSTFLWHSCGLSYPGGKAYCWGRNSSGQLGDGTTIDRLTPVPVAGGRQFRQIDAGNSHTCALGTDNRAFCWGADDVGQLGDGPQAQRHLRPVGVAGGFQFAQLDTGEDHTCAVTTSHVAYCWGAGGFGRIGDGKSLNRFTPRMVAGGLSFDRVTAGYSQSCGEQVGNQAYCWGWNLQGEIGDATTTQRLKPVAVSGGHFFSQVSAGRDFHTCARTADGVAYCWGNNAYGQLGDGRTDGHMTPTPVAGPM
ncbi:MAG: RCC1 domain-containing protein [Gemmatimonadales bacterium]